MKGRPAADLLDRSITHNPFLVCQRCGKKTVCKLYRNGVYTRLCLGCDPHDTAPQLPAVIPAPVIEEPIEPREFVLPPVVLERVTETIVERRTERTIERAIGTPPFHWQTQPGSRRRKGIA